MLERQQARRQAGCSHDQAVVATNGAVFPAGSPVVIEVATITRAGSADSSTIAFRVVSITVNDVTRVREGGS